MNRCPGRVITQLLGGLGNQMFQHAAARWVSQLHGTALKHDCSILLDHTPGRHDVNRTLDLDIFQLEFDPATMSERMWFNTHGLPLPLKVVSRIARPWIRHRLLEETAASRWDMDALRHGASPAYMAGKWQSPRFFQGIEEAIRQDYRFKESLPPQMEELASGIQSPLSVCLNVRRADYVSVQATADVLGFIGLDFYRNAVDLVRGKIGDNVRFYVFSDDLEWCRRELTWLPSNPVFVEHGFAGPKFAHYLQLMTLAHHFVIPNSTFAWWAAWLCERPDKMVVAPRDWFKDSSLNSGQICPLDWHLV